MDKIRILWRLKTLFKNPSTALKVLRDERTPLLSRVLPIVALVYIFFPIDIFPDIVPFIGQIDDITIALTLVSVALSMIPEAVLKDHGLSSEK